MRRSFITIPVFILLAVVVTSCATVDIFKTVQEKGGDLADQAYALVAEFDVVDAAALEFAESADTPAEVVSILKKFRHPARAAVPLLSEAAKGFRRVRNRLDDLENPSTLDELAATVSVLNENMEVFAPVVRNFIQYVDSL